MMSIGKLPIPISAQCQHNLLLPPCIRQPVPLFSCSYTTISFPRRHKNLAPVCSVLMMSVQSKEESKSESNGLPIMVNTPTGQMGRAVLESAIAAGLHPVPISLGSPRWPSQSCRKM